MTRWLRVHVRSVPAGRAALKAPAAADDEHEVSSSAPAFSAAAPDRPRDSALLRLLDSPIAGVAPWILMSLVAGCPRS